MTGALTGAGRGRVGSLALRAVAFAGPVLALLATAADGPWPRGWLVALTLALAAGFAAMPESLLGTLVLGLVVVWWGIADHDSVPPAAVLAALALLAAHVAAVLLSYGPAGLTPDARVVRTWLRRSAAVGWAAPAVWLLAVAFDGQPEPPGIWVAGLAAATAVCVVASVAVTVRDPSL